MTNRSHRRPENLLKHDGETQCRLTSEDRACGLHQGQSIHCSQTGRLCPPDKQEKATQTVLEQAEVLSAAWAVAAQ